MLWSGVKMGTTRPIEISFRMQVKSNFESIREKSKKVALRQIYLTVAHLTMSSTTSISMYILLLQMFTKGETDVTEMLQIMM